MTRGDFSDELFESLAPAGAQTPASKQLRDAVLSETTRTVRNRRRMRQARFAATLVACYLGGMATMSLWSSGRSADLVAGGREHGSVEKSETVVAPDAERLVRPEDDQVADVKPRAQLRLTAYERFCRDGDQQLVENDDIRAAAHSYKKALQLASADQRSIAPDRDTWLLMAMKQSNN